jgi:hypothetical protein
MTTDEAGRRVAPRYPRSIDVELNLKAGGKLAKTTDVSRHGLFVAMTEPPPDNHVVLLTVHLPGGPFETMATVMWSAEASSLGHTAGAGLKLYCLASEAKARWDRFIETVSGKEFSLTPRSAARADSVSFLVQLDSLDEIEEFVNKHVRPGEIVELTPAVKDEGTEILCVLVHPENHKEFILAAKVEELYEDRPHKMGVRFFSLDLAQRKRFREFIGVDERVRRAKAEAQVPERPLVQARRRTFTEYAFFSPKVRELDDEEAQAVADDELEVVQGDVLEAPELQLVDKGSLFDFGWYNTEATELTPPLDSRALAIDDEGEDD